MGRGTSVDLSQRCHRSTRRRGRRHSRHGPARQAPQRCTLEPALGDLTPSPRPEPGSNDRSSVVATHARARHRASQQAGAEHECIPSRAWRRRPDPITRRRSLRPMARRAVDERRPRAVPRRHYRRAERARRARRHPGAQRRVAPTKGRTRHDSRTARRLGTRRDRGERARRTIPSGTVAGPENGRVPRPAPRRGVGEHLRR